MYEILSRSVVDTARAIRDRAISAESVVSACLDRIQTVNPKINALVTAAPDPLVRARELDQMLEEGKVLGPLHGVPFTLKDSFDTAGVRSTWGTFGRKNTIPETNATVAQRLLEAGGILLGKTNTSEFTLSFFTNNRIFGATRNPYDLERMSGGSSGGAAALVAACGTPFDLGTDTGGSVRLPAHFCGIAGIRPTSGRTPRTGHAVPFGGLADLLTQVGPLARRVEDLEYLLRIISGPDGVDPYVMPIPLGESSDIDLNGLRVAFFRDNGVSTPTRETMESVERAATYLTEAGCSVEESRPPHLDESFDLLRGLLGATGRSWLKMALERAGTQLDESALSFVQSAEALAPDDLELLLERVDRFRSQTLAWFQKYDLLLSPVNATPALPVGDIEDQILNFTYTMSWNLTGWPTTVVRVGTSPEGLPIGVQVSAHPWREDRSLAAARAIERESGGWQPPPL